MTVSGDAREKRELEPHEEKLREIAIDEGIRVTENIFKRRGNHSEVHLGRNELAVIISAAWEAGFKACLRATDSMLDERKRLLEQPEAGRG
jgi:hypothetical protein